MLVCLLGSLRKAEVVGPGEELSPAIDAPGGEELLRADHAQECAELVADEVLAAVAAGEREVARLDVLAAREPRDHLRVLVVRVRADHQHARRDIEAGDGLSQCDCAALLRMQEARRECDDEECCECVAVQ